MKQLLKRMTALILAGSMCLGLGACGKKDSDETAQHETVAQSLGYGYLSEFSTLDDMPMDYVNGSSTSGGVLYVFGEKVLADGSYGPAFYAKNLTDGSVTEVPLPEMINNDTTSEYMQSISVCNDGSGYWILTNRYTYSWDTGIIEETPVEETAPAEEAAPTEEAAPAEEQPAETEDEGLSGQYEAVLLTDVQPIEEEPAEEPAEEQPAEEQTTEEQPTEDESIGEDEMVILPVGDNEDVMLAKKCDMNGNVLLEINLTDTAQENDYFYVQSMAQDGQGNLYLVADTMLLCFGPDGTRLADISLGENYYIETLLASEDGTVFASGYSYSETGYGLVLGRVENGGITPVELKQADGSNVPVDGNLYAGYGSTMFYSCGDVLYSLDTSNGTLTKILSWLDSDINSGALVGVVTDGDSKILVLLQHWSRNGGDMSYELGTLTKTPAEEIPERKVLTLGTVSRDDAVQDAIISFNRSSDTYRISLVDYSTYNTTEDYTLANKQLDMDLITGSAPDILMIDSGKLSRYVNKGAVLALDDLMKEDGFDTNTLLEAPRMAFTQNDKLYGIPGNFSVITMYGSAKILGDRTSWTLDDAAKIFDSLEDDQQVMQYYNQSDFLSLMLYWNLGQFVDYGKATCSFDSPEFQKLLELAAKLPAEIDYETEYDSMTYLDAYEMLQTGDLLMNMEWISDAYSVKSMYKLYTKENGIVRVGLPTDSGNGAIISVSEGLVISSRCSDAAGAWQFIKSTLTDENQLNSWNIPVTMSAFQSFIQQAMERVSYTDENGETQFYPSTGYIGSTEYEMGELTQADVDAFLEYVNGAAVSSAYDEDIMRLINENVAAYFAGDKSVEETCKLIQNQVAIYLGENS